MHVEDYARMNVAAVAEDRLPDELFWKLRTSHRFEINLSNRDAWPVAARDEVARIGASGSGLQPEHPVESPIDLAHERGRQVGDGRLQIGLVQSHQGRDVNH